VLTTSY